jgi:hypothetical protein
MHILFIEVLIIVFYACNSKMFINSREFKPIEQGAGELTCDREGTSSRGEIIKSIVTVAQNH